MDLIPNWAPNAHPMIVHFPIAIIIVAILFDFLSLLIRKQTWLRMSAHALYFLGAIAALVTFFSGRQAADSVIIPTESYPVISEHADLALYTVVFFWIYILLRLILVWKKYDLKFLLGWFFFSLALVGSFILFKTAEHGAELVYKYGLGVQAVQQVQAPSSVKEESSFGLITKKNGSWQWIIDKEADQELVEKFTWHAGNSEDVKLTVDDDNQQKGKVLSIKVSGGDYLFTVGYPIEGVQTEANINLVDFNGEFKLIHHFSNMDNYDFVSVKANKMILGRQQNGEIKEFEAEGFTPEEWITLKAVGDGSHFRGYVNDKLITHGHASELEAGQAGFSFNGTGTIFIKKIEITSIQKNNNG